MEICKFTLHKPYIMNLSSPKIVLYVLLNLLLVTPLFAQSLFDLSFQGKLADIENKVIGNEDFDLIVQVTRQSGPEVLYEIKTSLASDENGWFGYTIPKISHFLMDGGEISNLVDIKMEILPNEKTKWMRKGEDFMVSYTLKAFRDSVDYQLMMTRMEGSKLVMHSEEHLFAFKDIDPFGYLLGGFLISDEPPISDQSLLDLQQWLIPEASEETPQPSRGVKGDFPKGGYQKKK